MSVDDFHTAYDTVLAKWPAGTTALDLRSPYGTTRVLAHGPQDGEPLVLLPGGGAGATVWCALAAELGDRYRVYAVDPPGDAGRGVAGDRPLARPADLTAWLTSVLDGLGLDRTNLGGHSYGAWQALGHALHDPGRIGRLVLLDPTRCFAGLRPGYLLRALPMLARPSAERVRAFLAWECEGAAVDEDWQRQFALGAAELPRPKPVIGRRPGPAALRALDVPTLVLLAGRSRAHHLGKVAAGARALPDVRLATLPGSSHHSLPAAGAGEVGALLREFLGGGAAPAQAALGSSL
ncbi:alpha/beta fold hydrolase [Kitasatospora sp. MBT63]|uniref:alpha/beta fold hydrolase n=1 Tax=Kitasatospora sp. MBT63 TaxID=1444768 RepID=UPI000539EF35|nr:alpha/beta hydrolase [Kitasatospora sp. MBT63]